jgi:hypothetical protein
MKQEMQVMWQVYRTLTAHITPVFIFLRVYHWFRETISDLLDEISGSHGDEHEEGWRIRRCTM